jgi:hypothetical protein
MTRLSIGSLALLTTAAFFFDGGMKHASALPNQDAGVHACYAWCYKHNKTIPSQVSCINRCTDYYCRNGLASAVVCSSPPLLGSPPPTGTNPPPGPGRVKPPPLKGTTPPPKLLGPVRVNPPVAVSNPGGSNQTGGTIESAGPHHGKNKR